jgi:hypothetical protein
MPYVTSMLMAGLAAVGAWALVVPAAEPASKVSAVGTGDIHWPMDLAFKGDRMSLPGLRRSDENTVTTVEVIGLRDASVIYRDRDGRILFQTDPLSNVTIVAKGVVMPELTVRESMRSTPARIEVPAALQAPPIPVGCDPVVSAIAEPGLSLHLARVTGHCVSQRDDDLASSVKSS